MVPAIVITGAGNIGSRHMQSFAVSVKPIRLFIIDPSAEALKKARTLWDNAHKTFKSQATAVFQTDFKNIPAAVDMLIVATNANHRLTALSSSLEHTKPAFIILEKFLFNNPTDYETANALLKSYASNTVFVNCPRRLFEAYSFLFQEIDSNKPFIMRVTGSGWGMGSNAIHFIDLFSMFTGDKPMKGCHFVEPEKTLIEASKRDGYIELFGEIVVTSENNAELRLCCDNDAFSGMQINVVQGEKEYIVLEKEGKITITSNSQVIHTSNIPFQSQLSHSYFETLVVQQTDFLLPTYSVSEKLHLLFLTAMQQLATIKKTSETWNVS